MSLEPAVGFALVTYRDTEMVCRLLATLNRAFGDPPVSIHHDSRQSKLDLSAFGGNVRLVGTARRTGWGTMQTALAMAETISHLMSRSDAPRWFYLVTGHCYPLVTGDEARGFLDSSPYDLYMEQSPFYPGGVDNSPRYEEWCERYIYPQLRYPFPIRHGRIGMRTHILARSGKGSPFGEAYPCRSGSTYFTGNFAVAEAIEAGLADDRLLRWFAKRPVVDEAFVQTILGNTPGLRISNDNLRFIKWPDLRLEPNEEKPKTLTMADAPEIARSGAHFARKFLPKRSDELIAWIDRERLAGRRCERTPASMSRMI
ncbi:MAG TPA: beta-1,6-N-acetylglucosaminyltransferase [Fimbriimonadaceae bacterium]|nr:beta-1,6-N-acetylglucosaminyltransferase [Fimbriimonadaceae bacterium]